jgi:hypothetical protein
VTLGDIRRPGDPAFVGITLAMGILSSGRGGDSPYGASGGTVGNNSGTAGQTNGASATGYGAGGGGGISSGSAGATAGGNGSGGLVIVWEYR